MGVPQVIWSDDVQAADWLIQRLSSHPAVVSTVIPRGFAAYVRLLHPTHVPDGAAVPGAEPPTEGALPLDQAAALAGVLADFTTTPRRCWFGVWDGYGWLYQGRSVHQLARQDRSVRRLAHQDRPAPRIERQGDARRIERQGDAAPAPPAPAWVGVETAPRVHAPDRDYLLYTGPLSAATALATGDWRQTPNLWWPDDHAWCVASEIDLPSTYIGGARQLIERLLADARFEALAVQPTDPLVGASDTPGGSS